MLPYINTRISTAPVKPFHVTDYVCSVRLCLKHIGRINRRMQAEIFRSALLNRC